jgi:hypothetical protein
MHYLFQQFDLRKEQSPPDGPVDFREDIGPTAALFEGRPTLPRGIRNALRAVHLYRVPLAHPVRRSVAGASEEGLEGRRAHFRQTEIDRGRIQISRDCVLPSPEARWRTPRCTRPGGEVIFDVCGDDDV